MKRHRWVWVLVFIFVCALLVTLATSWNVVLVQNYQRMLEAARGIQETPPWLGTILGTVGFLAAFSGVILIFARLFREMKITQMQAEFLAHVSHELKTPISTIELTSSLLRERKPDDADWPRLWQLHDDELRRLKSEVNALLEAARWEARPLRPKRQPVDLDRWISGAAPRWKSVLGPESTLETESGDRLPGAALADERVLDLVANNIVDNVRKFARGKPVLRVQRRHLPEAGKNGRDHWQLVFRDEGVGFPAKASSRIFRRFHRERTDAGHAIPGTGLGLYLARQAARSVGMRLSAASPGEGKGAEFVLEGRYAQEGDS